MEINNLIPNNASNILFDRFEIIDTLKKDQHTSVYLANHVYLGKKIILKTLSALELPDQTFLDRFKREAKILARLDHPNLIKVLDFGTAGDNFYISFEYFEGKNLRKIIKENNLSNEQKIYLSVQLFKALSIAHQNGVVHRDIKPENILVNTKLELKIADFGLAFVRDDLFLTHKSSIVGTPGYMSPEQIRGQELTPQTDLFSSGIVIYELFTGKNPFIGKDTNIGLGTKKKPVTKKENDIEKVTYGELFVEANPWAEIYINNRKIETTPLEQGIQLDAGSYELRLVHPDFPSYFESIEIKQNKLRTVKINFYEKVGYLDCKIYPWGEIYIDGKYKSTSPLLKPVVLMPGNYSLSIRNPGYNKDIEEVITVKAKETLTLRFNFDDLKNN